MSRSYKKSPVHAWCNTRLMKQFKKQEHSRERHEVKQTLRQYLDDTVLPHPKKYGNEWASPRDGKWFMYGPWVDKEWCKELMRK